MAIPVIIAYIGTLLAGLWSGFKYVSSKALTIAIAGFDLLKKGFDWFLKTAPRYLQLMFFFFIIIFIADVLVGFFVGLNYACLSTNELRTPHSFAGGLTMYIEGVFKDFENSTTDYDVFISEKTIPATQYTDLGDARSMFSIRCYDVNPVLTFYGLEFLNWKYWIIILLLGLIFKVGKDFNIF